MTGKKEMAQNNITSLSLSLSYPASMKGSVHELMCLPCLTDINNGNERLEYELLVETRIA